MVHKHLNLTGLFPCDGRFRHTGVGGAHVFLIPVTDLHVTVLGKKVVLMIVRRSRNHNRFDTLVNGPLMQEYAETRPSTVKSRTHKHRVGRIVIFQAH